MTLRARIAIALAFAILALALTIVIAVNLYHDMMRVTNLGGLALLDVMSMYASYAVLVAAGEPRRGPDTEVRK